MSEYKILFDQNIERVNSLCNLYRFLKNSSVKEGQDYKFTDLLRSAVVLLHSSFEEYFRSVLRDKLPIVCDEKTLNAFSFTGSEGKHVEKIRLGDLQKFKGHMVDELIVNSISEELDSTSFNNYNDILSWAGKAGVDLSSFTKQAEIGKLVKRRHKIVHEADKNKTASSYKLSSISLATVQEWINADCELVDIIEESL